MTRAGTDVDRGVNCTGADDCPAYLHVHGCYADRGACDAPSEHFATRGASDD